MKTARSKRSAYTACPLSGRSPPWKSLNPRVPKAGQDGTCGGRVRGQPLAAQRHPAAPAQLPRQPCSRRRLGRSLQACGCGGPGPARPGTATGECGPRWCRAPAAAGPGSASAALAALCRCPAPLHGRACGPAALAKAGAGRVRI